MNKRPPFAHTGKKAKKGTFKRLLRYMLKDKLLIAFVVITTLLASLFDLFIPILEGEIINILDVTTLPIDLHALYIVLIIMGVLALLVAILSYFNSFGFAKEAVRIARRLREDLFNKIVKLPISFIDSHPHGDLMSRMSNDIETISNTIMNSMVSILESVFTITITICLMFYFSWILTLTALIALVLTVIIFKLIHKFGRKYFVKQQSILGDLNAISEEDIQGSRTLIAYNLQDQEIKKFNEVSDELKENATKASNISMAMPPIMNFINNLSYLLIVIVGGYLTVTNRLELGTILIFVTFSKKFTRPINQLGQLFTQIQISLVSAERVFEVIDHDVEIDEGYDTLGKDIKGHIEIKNVNFSYVKDEPVLKNFSLTINPGEKIALVGATGSGKTTIVNLLMRFYEVDSGEILVDGKDIRSLTKKSLRDSIAIVLQDTVLFNDTIKNNVKYANHSASEEEIVEACKTSYADYFICHTDDKYDTLLKEQGNNISQGQKQLLAIARVILKDPRILILDEATSNVDTRTEKHIQDAMLQLMKNRTSIVIAHRLSTIQDADKIVVIDKGEIVEVGNHYQLLQQKGKYYSLYNTQFEGNEI